MEELPRYEISIDDQYKTGDEELGIDMIAFTSDPAILVKGVAFKAQKRSFFADDKKYRITAPAMIPMDIYRRDEDGEYEVTFTEEVIDDMHKKFMSNLNNKDLFNLEHNAEQKVPAYILEAWIVEKPKEDKAYSTFGLEVPEGTLMVTAQITDKDYYNSLVENGQVGFSIEGFLGLSLPKEQVNNYSMQLPDGEHLIDGKVYVVKDGQVIEVKEQEEVVMAEEPAVEEMAEAPVAEVESEMAEEVVEEEKVEEEMAVDPAVDTEAILAIVQPIIDEVYQVIADLKNEMAEAASEAPAEVEVEMNKNQGFKNFLNFVKNG